MALASCSFFRQADAEETFHHRLAAAPSRLADDIHGTTILSRGFGLFWLRGSSRKRLLGRREPLAGQGIKWIVTKFLAAFRGNAFWAAHLLFSRHG